MDLLELRAEGLYCPGGDFYIDPWAPVSRAVVTHAHPDRACPGSGAYLTARPGVDLLRAAVGAGAAIQPLEYGEHIALGDTGLSLHPAGHVLGSAQARIEHRGETWVVAGDFKLAPDPSCAPFELLRCHTFVTGAPFALPVFRWPAEDEVAAGIRDWWRANQDAGKVSVLEAAPLGQAQRVLARLDPANGPIWLHPEVERYCAIYRAQGVPLPASAGLSAATLRIVPPGSEERGARLSTALASGWMRIRGTRRRRSLDRGFVWSDNADWPSLLRVIDETGAASVWVTHGFRAPLVRWLEEHGRQARAVETRFEGVAP